MKILKISQLKTGFIMPTTDFFVVCPYCEKVIETNTTGKRQREYCHEKFDVVYDQKEFIDIIESNIY